MRPTPRWLRRADAIGYDVEELRAEGLAGTPDEIVQRIGEYAAAGSQRIYLQTLDLYDLDHLELVAGRSCLSCDGLHLG